MTLNEICRMFAEIEECLMYGEISFSYDNLMCAVKPGHPADILDEILGTIYWDVLANKEIPISTLKSTLADFKEFKKAFKVKELKKPIEELSLYIKNQKEAENDE